MNFEALKSLMKLIDSIRDEEVIANGCKCIRILLRNEEYLSMIATETNNRDLVN